MTYTDNKTNRAGQTTIKVEAPSVDEAWEQVRDQNRRLAANEGETEQDRFLALATRVVNTSKQDIARTEAEEKARKRLQESGERRANGEVPKTDADPQWRKDRIAKLTEA